MAFIMVHFLRETKKDIKIIDSTDFVGMLIVLVELPWFSFDRVIVTIGEAMHSSTDCRDLEATWSDAGN